MACNEAAWPANSTVRFDTNKRVPYSFVDWLKSGCNVYRIVVRGESATTIGANRSANRQAGVDAHANSQHVTVRIHIDTNGPPHTEKNTMENTRTALSGFDFYFSADLWITIAVAIALCVVCVLFHYEMFSLLGRGLRRARGRIRIVYVILGLMVVHAVEIWLFAIAYYLLAKINVGALTGVHGNVLYDHVYYSAAVYTTIGFGDIVPVGAFKLLTGTEALVGLALITWSASFTFFEMQATWSDDV